MRTVFAATAEAASGRTRRKDFAAYVYLRLPLGRG